MLLWTSPTLREEACGVTKKKCQAQIHSHSAVSLSGSVAPYLGWAKAHFPVLIQGLESSHESRACNCLWKNWKKDTVFLLKVTHRESGISVIAICCYPSLFEALAHKMGKADSKGWEDPNPTPQLGFWTNSSRLNCRSEMGDTRTANWGCSTALKGTRFFCFSITDNLNSFFFTDSELKGKKEIKTHSQGPDAELWSPQRVQKFIHSLPCIAC